MLLPTPLCPLLAFWDLQLGGAGSSPGLMFLCR